MNHYQLVTNNKRRSAIIMVSFVLFTLVVSSVMITALDLNLSLIGVAFIFSGLMSFASYWWSDKIILTISGARPASREEFFDFYTTVENLTIGQRFPMPKLYVIDDNAMNAFATGRNPENAVICATTGLLNRLNRSEVEGVMAHELAHIGNYDMLLMSIVTILVGMISLLSDWFLRMTWIGGRRKSSDDKGSGQIQLFLMIAGLILALLSPLIAQLIKLALSRKREYLADSTGVAYSRNPAGLANALEKISQDREPLKAANKATAHLYIANPLKNRKDAIGMFANLFQTHPPIEERIANLRALV
ncbi:MAG: Protease HtpX-like protein [Microgenomates bacterium 39_7]|nr:MAG: Protease HtpX-like protein [Microgenomates bacterium 39_7]